MKPYILFFSLVITVYGGLNTYIAIRGWQAFGPLIPAGYGKLYWMVFMFFALAYFAGRIGDKLFAGPASHSLTLIGAYWLVFIYYGVILLLFIDLLRFLDRKLSFIPAGIKTAPATVGLIMVFFLFGTLVYGTWNARKPVFRPYEITIPKTTPNLTDLHIIIVSDLHLGKIVHNARLTHLVNQIKDRNPDLILLPGDIIDENIGPFVAQGMDKTWQTLTPKYGIYTVLGNHEYLGGQVEEVLHCLNQAGIRVLRDEHVLIEESFYLVGRDDLARAHFETNPRKDLPTLMQGIDLALPIILLDHQPFNLAEAQTAGVDLQLSGHTHRGQFFPNQLITQKLFENDGGYLCKDTLQVIVSSGFGTWGPPIRIGNKPEIIDLQLYFNPRPSETIPGGR